MVMLAVGARAQNTTYNSPGNTITINSDMAYSGDVFISPQTTVVVNSGVQIVMPPGRTIYVDKAGARLIIKGKITSNPQNITGSMWRGIEVIGDNNSLLPNLNTIVNINSQTPTNSNHGVLIFDGAEIVGMTAGVIASERGIVYSTNSTFDYCNKSISIYSFIGPSTNTINPNISSINNTTFINRELNLGGISQIVCVHVRGVTISNCSILPIGASKQGVGISALESNISVSQCIFSNMHTPIQIQSIGIAMGSQIKSNTFENNRRGLSIIGSNHPLITGNSFTTNNPETFNSGTEIEGSYGYIIQNNSFSGYYQNFYQRVISTLRVTNSGIFGNVINNNTFENNLTGVSAFHNNRGLQIKCNDFNVLSSIIPDGDIYVFSNPTFNIDSVGIPNQGVFMPNDIQGYFLPNNKFSQSCYFSENNFGDINTNDFVPNFKYITYSSTPSPFTPECYRQNKVQLTGVLYGDISQRNSACNSYLNNRFNMTGIMSDITSKQNIMNTLLQQEEDYVEEIEYLKQSINADVGAALSIMLEEDDINFQNISILLAEDTSIYKKMLYAQFLLYYDSIAHAQQILQQIPESSNIEDVVIFKLYYSRLTELLLQNADLYSLNDNDLILFQSVAESATPTAAKAQLLIGMQTTNNISTQVKTHKQGDIIKLKVYPNPTQDVLNILNVSNNAEYIIYDSRLRSIQTGNFIHSNQINISTFDNGLYFLIIKLSGQTETIRFVVNK